MHTISIPFSSLTASPTNVIISRSTNVMGHPKFVKLPRIGRNSGNLAINSHPNPAVAVEPSGGEDNVVGEKDGVVVVDHGSRRQESNLLLNEFVAMFRARTGYRIVEPAHMELAEPTIMDAFGQCVQQGACRIIVSPYFLSPGRHWQKDVMNDRIKHCLSQVAGNADECSVCARTGKCRLYP